MSGKAAAPIVPPAMVKAISNQRERKPTSRMEDLMIDNAATVTTGPERSSSCRHIGPQSVPKVNLAPGDPVKAGDVAIIMESLKMELRIVSEIAGVVAAIHGKPGETVDRNAVVAMIEPQ